MEHDQRQELVEQRAMNGQTLQFLADRLAEMADQADQLARKEPGWAAMAAAERAHRDTLMEAAAEERRLATAINMEAETALALAATERELRKDLLEIAREENHTADQLHAREAEDNPMVAILAEQAERNRQLLRYVARTATDAAKALREDGQRQ